MVNHPQVPITAGRATDARVTLKSSTSFTRPARMPWLLLTCIVASLTLALCWWPFNFFPVNDVLIAPEQGTAFFNMGLAAGSPYGRGQAVTAEPVSFDAAQGATLRFVLTPTEKPAGLGCILTLHDGGERAPFVIAQWKEHLALFVRARETAKGYREVGLPSALPIGKTTTLDLVTTTRETKVLINGQPRVVYTGFSLFGERGQIQGRLILANNQHGTEPWHGSIERVTVHGAALSNPLAGYAMQHPLLAHNFAAGKMQIGGDQQAAPARFTIPAKFEPVAPIFLLPLSRQAFHRNSTWTDFAWNILGFLPISACFFLLCGTVISRPALPFGLTVLAGFLFSLLIESGQVFLPTRHSSQLDLLCNTAGATLAASILMADSYWKKRRDISLRSLA